MFNKSTKYHLEVKRIFNDYHKHLTGNDYTSRAKVFEFIHACNPNFQTEILYIMFNAGYKAALNLFDEKVRKLKVKEGKSNNDK